MNKDQSIKRNLKDNEKDSVFKKPRNQDEQNVDQPVSSSTLNEPTLSLSHGCVMYAYNQKQDLRINEMIEVFGIIELPKLEKANHLEQNQSSPHNNFYIESDEDAFPHSTYFRVHSLLYRPLKSLITVPASKKLWLNNSENVLKIRSELIAIFTHILFGDEIAAEFLLSCLISNVYRRFETLCVGSFPLNLTNIPKMNKADTTFYIKSLFDILSSFVPLSYLYALTITDLNKDNIEPKKNCNVKLIPGRLHLPAGCLLVLNETTLETGQLHSTGVQNVQAIKNLIKFQKINLHFDYYITQAETNINILAISEGKSLLSFDCQIPIKVSIMYEL